MTLYNRLRRLDAPAVVSTGLVAPPQKQPQPTVLKEVKQHRFLEQHLELKNRVQAQLAQDLDVKLVASGKQLSDQQRVEIRSRISALLEAEADIPLFEREQISNELIAEIIGFGPIQPLLDDDSVAEVMVNGANHIYVERHGRIELTPVRFASDAAVLQLIERIVAPLGRRIDEGSPMVDARLPDGSRVNAIIPPLSLKGPSITIRKFARDPLTIADLIKFGTLSADMAAYLEACVKSRLNVLISGGTGSGKTTTLNVLSMFVPADERIVTIEDAAELQLRQDHVVSLETRPANLEGEGEINIRHLVRNALRMRPDRIIVGEVRGGEALDMLQAMNTGHDGSLTTGHANSPRDMLSRLETMVLMAGVELPIKAIREQVGSAIDLIVHQSRLRDGTRRITHITEVQGLEGDVIVLQDVFLYRQYETTRDGKIVGEFAPTGIRPQSFERLATAGFLLPPAMFEPRGGGQ